MRMRTKAWEERTTRRKIKRTLDRRRLQLVSLSVSIGKNNKINQPLFDILAFI